MSKRGNLGLKRIKMHCICKLPLDGDRLVSGTRQKMEIAEKLIERVRKRPARDDAQTLVGVYDVAPPKVVQEVQ